MRDGYLRGALSRSATPRQRDVLAAYVVAGSVPDAAALVGIRPSTAKRHLADLRARSGLTTEQLTYVGRAAEWLVIPSLEPPSAPESRSEDLLCQRGYRPRDPVLVGPAEVMDQHAVRVHADIEE